MTMRLVIKGHGDHPNDFAKMKGAAWLDFEGREAMVTGNLNDEILIPKVEEIVLYIPSGHFQDWGVIHVKGSHGNP